MLPKTFKIVYLLNGKTISTECSAYSLHEYIDKLIEDGSKVICLFAKNNKSKKPLDVIIQDTITIINSIKAIE